MLEAKDNSPEKKTTVRKRMCSFPIGLHNWAERQAKRIAKATGREPNFSGYLASLLFDAKQNAKAKKVEQN